MYKDNRLVESLYTTNVMNHTGYSDSSGRFMMNSIPMGTLLKGHAAQERPSPEGAGCSVCDSHSGPWTGLAGSLPTPYVHPRVHAKWSTVSPNGPGYNSINSTGTKRETRFDTGRLCKRCISHFNIFKREALKLITEERLSVKDPKVSMYLYESMKPPARTIDAWSNMDERCGVCSTHYSQLKQEAIRTILTQDQAIWTSSSTANTLSPRLRSRAPHCSQTLPRTTTHRSQSPDPRQIPTNASPDYWNKGRQHFGTLWPLSSCKGSHSAPQKDEMEKQSLGSTALCNYSGSPPSRASSMSSLIPAGTSAALSYFVRAVQKLNGMVRRGRQFSESGSSSNLTNFSTVLLKSPPPVPASLLQAANKSKDIPGIGKVKVMLRVCSVPVSDPTPPHSYKLELRKKQITVLDLGDVKHHRLVPTKTFNFDAAFGHDATQAEVCESSLSELLQWVLAGADGCVLSFGQTSEGMSYTMIGRDDCSLSLGVVPCAISWLFKLIHRKRDKTWANISVSVSAVEVCGETNAIRDLLSAVDTDSGEENCGPDPVCGIQLSHQRVLNAPTSERAAFLLDAALAARGGDVPHHSCHMFFNLHIRQQHIGNKSAMKVDQSKLSLIDLGSCVGDKDDSNCGVCLADLGNVITDKLNRHKHVSNRGSKLAMLLQDSLSNTNCATTIIAHISTSPRDVTESLCTMQTVSRIRKQHKKIRTQSSSSSPGGQSSGNERKVNTATKFRFKSTGALDKEISSGGFFAEPEFHPGLEKTSCETVLPMEPSGILNKEAKNRSREVSPVIPSSLRSKLETKKISLMKLCEISPPIGCRMKPMLKDKTWEESSTGLQDEPDVECLKCNTFAELQNRLGNIDLDETDLYPTKDQVVKILIKPSNSSKSEEKSISAEAQVSRKGEAESARPKNTAKALAGVKSRNAIPDEANPQTLSHLGALRHNTAILSSSPSSGENQQNENMSLTLEDRDIYSDDSAKQPDTRLSPAGKSSPRSTSSSSFSSALSASLVSPLPASVIEEPQSQREMRATITVTVQQPIDLNGQDELVYTVVEEVTINGGHEKGKAKILSIHESRSLQGLAQENQPVRIIGSVGEEPTTSFYPSQGNSQTLKNENPTENAPANTTNAHNSEHLDPKDLQQHEAWPDVPLTEDMKDALQETDVSRTTASKIHEDSLSKQYACEITPNQSWLCQSQNSQNKEMTYKKAEHKHRHLESKQPQNDGPGDCCKDLTPHSLNLKKKESTLSRSAAVKQKHLLTRSPSEDSSKLFNAKLKALSGRSQTLDQSKSSWSSAESLERNCSSPILKSRILQESACIDLPHKSLLDRDYFPACSSMSSPGVKEDFHDDLAMCPAVGSPGRVPRFFPIRDMDASDTTWPSKATCLEATGLTKLKPNPRINKASGAHPKNIVTSKSTRRSINRSSSFSPSGACLSQSSWSTQSLSRTQESTRMSGRMDLLRYSRDSLSTLNQSQLDESEELVTPFVHTLPSPYSQITAPREPYHCSGHASDTTSILSGDLPPAMCKTALLYNRSSVVSSGYESMLRDSEATISSSSTHNSISDHSCSAAAKGTRSLKKRSNMGSSPRRPSQEPGLTLKRSSSGPKVHRVDRNVSDSYEIKVYEIDNVDGLQKRSGAGNKGIVRFSAKLKFLEHRQQRIAEVRAKFTALKRELDVAKQHLMLDPGKWNRKFDLWQTFEVDSLEHLEALEQVTERLQNHLHLCKTHILMVTCFDVADKRRQKFKHRPGVDLKGFVGI